MSKTRAWKSGNRMVAGICCAVLVSMLFSSFEVMQLSAKTTVGELNAKIEQLEDELKAAEEARKKAEKKYQSVKDDYEDMQARKEAIDAEADAIEREAEALRSVELGYAEQEAVLNRRIAAMEQELDELMATVKDRLRLSYEDSRADILTLLLTSEGLYEFLTAAERLSVLAEQEKAMIRQCEAAASSLRTEKEALAETVASANETEERLRDTLTQLDTKQAEITKMLADLEKDAEAYYKALEQAEKAEKEYQKQLKDKLEQLAQIGSPEYNGGKFVWPLPAKYTKISSPFGNRIHPVTGKPQFHEGIDIPAPPKTEIYCVADGTVIETGTHYANGKYVLVDHGGGIVTSYAHLHRIGVKKGDVLEQGEVLGLVGRTGWTTGYHLDFTVYVKGEAVDPMTYLPKQ